MYLVPERTRIDRLQNEQTLKLAQATKAKKILEIQEGRVEVHKVNRKDVLLTDYIRELSGSYLRRGQTEYCNTLEKIAVKLEQFGRRMSLGRATKEYVLDFLQFLRDRGLSDSTIFMYYSNLNSVFNFAFRERLIIENPMHRIDKTQRPRKPESEREYLTLDEVRLLMQTPMKNEEVKNAFLFACFTGLRLCDIENLRWENIKPSADGGWQVETRQKKTRNIVVIPLSANAVDLMPQRKEAKDKVWSRLPGRMTIGTDIKAWVSRAGIEKHITFHCSRHTNATLLLTYGVDLYTVSSLLGHKHIATTEIYAKIINAKKVAAVNMIPKI